MKMIPAIRGNDDRATCPDCKQSYTKSNGHGCTARKSKGKR